MTSHLYGDEALICNSRAKRVLKIIIPATAAENFARVLALAERFSSLYAALGLHPIVIEQHTDEDLARLQQTLETRPTKVVAIGEIGWIGIATIRNLPCKSGFWRHSYSWPCATIYR